MRVTIRLFAGLIAHVVVATNARGRIIAVPAEWPFLCIQRVTSCGQVAYGSYLGVAGSTGSYCTPPFMTL